MLSRKIRLWGIFVCYETIFWYDSSSEGQQNIPIWRDGRVVEGAALEMLFTLTG